MTLRIYYRSIHVQGRDHIPRTGALLVVANHPNSLLDPAILCHVFPRSIHFGARHTLFAGPLSPVLSSFGAIPLVRAQDDKRALRRNLKAIDRYVSLLTSGKAAAIFPEGVSHDEPRLAPLKTGAARIALDAEAKEGFTLGLRILPIGLQFEPRSRFRSNAFVRFGRAFGIADLESLHRNNPRKAVRDLTEQIGRRLQTLSFHVDSDKHLKLVERVVDIYMQRARLRGLAGVTAQGLRGELRQKTAVCLNHFSRIDPMVVVRVEKAVDRYERLREAAGVDRRLLEEPIGLVGGPLAPVQAGLEAVLGAPVAVFGIITSGIPYLVTRGLARWVARRRHDWSALSFSHIAIGLVAFPLAYGAQLVFMTRHYSQWSTALFAVCLLPAGLFGLAYLKRMQRLIIHLGGRAANWTKLGPIARVATAQQQLLDLLDELRDRYRVEVLGWPPLASQRRQKHS